MLSKLLKYDLKSMFKVFIPLWIALIVVSIVNRFTLHQTQYDTPQVLSMILYVSLFAAVMVVAVVLIIMRFYNGLLKDEGYLMFTLPVRPWQLVTSKALSAMIIIVLSLMFGAGSIFLVAMGSFTWADVRLFFQQLAQMLNTDIVLTMVLSVILMVSGITASVTHVYASLALGHLAPSHRIGWAVAAYIGINILFTAIGSLITKAMGHLDLDFNWVLTQYQEINLCLGLLIGICVVQIVIFFVTTERILSKRLNLE